MIPDMDEELLEVIRSRELRSQHIPRTMSKWEKFDENLWTLHDNEHTGTYIGCGTCELMKAQRFT